MFTQAVFVLRTDQLVRAALMPCMSWYLGAHVAGCGSSTVRAREQTLRALSLMIPPFMSWLHQGPELF